jgi:hypothetical protein
MKVINIYFKLIYKLKVRTRKREREREKGKKEREREREKYLRNMFFDWFIFKQEKVLD